MLLLTEKQTRKASRGHRERHGEGSEMSAVDSNTIVQAVTQGMYEEALEKNVKLGTLLMVWCMKTHIAKTLGGAVSQWKLFTQVENVRVEMQLKMKKLVENLEMEKMMMKRQTDNPWFHTAISLLSLDKKRERSKSPHPLERARSNNRRSSNGKQFNNNDHNGNNYSVSSDNGNIRPYQSRSMSPSAGRNRRGNVFHKPIHGSLTPDPVTSGGYSYYSSGNQQESEGSRQQNMYVATMLSPQDNNEVRSNTSESSSRPSSPRYLGLTKNFEESRWHQYNQKHSPDFSVHGRHQNHPQTVREYQNRLKMFHEHRKAISRLSRAGSQSRSASSSPQREFASTYNDLESVSAYSLPSSRKHSQLASYNEYGSNKYSDSRQLRGRSRYRSMERVQSSSYLHPTTSSMKKIATSKVSRIRRQHDEEHDPAHSHFMGHTPMLKSVKRGKYIFMSNKSNQLKLSGKSRQMPPQTMNNRGYKAQPVTTKHVQTNMGFQSSEQKSNGMVSHKNHFMEATSSSRHHEPSQKLRAMVKAQHDSEYDSPTAAAVEPSTMCFQSTKQKSNGMVGHESNGMTKDKNHFMEATSSSRHHEASQKLRASVKAQHDSEYDSPTTDFVEPSAEELLIRQRDMDNPERRGMVSTLTQISEEEIVLEDGGNSHNNSTEESLSAHDHDLLSSLLNDPSVLAATTTESTGAPSTSGTVESKQLDQAGIPNEDELFRAVSGDAAMAILEINSLIHTRDCQPNAANGNVLEKESKKHSSKHHLTSAQKKLLEGDLEEDTFSEGLRTWDHSLRKH